MSAGRVQDYKESANSNITATESTKQKIMVPTHNCRFLHQLQTNIAAALKVFLKRSWEMQLRSTVSTIAEKKPWLPESSGHESY